MMGVEQMKKNLIKSIVIIVSIIAIALFIKWRLQDFLQSYQIYISKDITHQAELFESIISGVCAGMVTFGALFITILHENNKDQKNWNNERKKAKEERLLSVRPFLNIECQSVSVLRNNKIENRENCVIIGHGNYYRYVKIRISNQGFGKCNKIFLGNNRCSIDHLEVDEENELTIYFVGFDSSSLPTQFLMSFCYQNIFGNKYVQQFSCILNKAKSEMEINIGEPLLKEENE